MLTKLNHVLLAGVVALACSSCQTEKKADYQVIPLPQEVVLTQEKPFLLNKNVSITYPEGNLLLKRNAEFLSGYIRQATGYTPPVKGLKDGETAKHAINYRTFMIQPMTKYSPKHKHNSDIHNK